MTYINDINVNKAILHILNNDGSNPIVADRELKLDERIYKYVFKNLEKVAKEKNLKCAKFNEGAGALKVLSRKFFEGNLSFIDISKKLSEEFYEIMRENPTIPNGDLLFSDLATDKGQVLSILKLDHVTTMEHVVRNSNIEIKDSVGLPLSSSKIQKALFIFKNSDMDYNLCFIDKGKRKKDGEYDSNYFLNSFIDGYIVNTSLDYTKDVVSTTVKWIDENIHDDIEAVSLKSNLKEVLKKTNSTNVDELADEILNDDFEKADSLKEAFIENLNKEEVEIDSNYIAKEFSKTKLKLDNTIDITLPTDILNDTSKVRVVKNEDGTIDFIFKFVKELIEK